MFQKQSVLFLILAIVCARHFGQENSNEQYRIMFYNVENLFDTIDTPGKNDKEFLPEGTKQWNSYRYWQKVKKTYQVIAALGQSTPPDIVGLCEVEGFLPLYNLTNNTLLSKFPYTIVHNESPDWRGIDVALLIRNDRIKLLKKEFIEVVFPRDTLSTTREILYASLKIKEDTLHVFVNHWPSRWGGQAKSEPRRMHASTILINAIDSLRTQKENVKIIVLGDFNDEPNNKSIQQLVEQTELLNLSEPFRKECKCGSYRYKSEWNMLDQILISEPLLNEEGLSTTEEGFKVFNNEFLLKDDTKYGGVKPYRTYLGPRYIGGYSDHLPVLLDLQYKD